MRQNMHPNDPGGLEAQFLRPPDPDRSGPHPLLPLTPIRPSQAPARFGGDATSDDMLVHRSEHRSWSAHPTTPPRRPPSFSPSPNTSRTPQNAQLASSDDRIDAEHCEIIQLCAAEVEQAIGNLVAACAARGRDNKVTAAKVSGFMAEDIAKYQVLVLHVASQPHHITVPGNDTSVHPSYCVATKPRNDLGGALWKSIKSLVGCSHILYNFLY